MLTINLNLKFKAQATQMADLAEADVATLSGPTGPTLAPVPTPVVKAATPAAPVETALAPVPTPVVKAATPAAPVETALAPVPTPVVKAATPAAPVETALTPAAPAATPAAQVETKALTPAAPVETKAATPAAPVVPVATPHGVATIGAGPGSASQPVMLSDEMLKTLREMGWCQATPKDLIPVDSKVAAPVVEAPKPPVLEAPKPPVVEAPKPPVLEAPKPPVAAPLEMSKLVDSKRVANGAAFGGLTPQGSVPTQALLKAEQTNLDQKQAYSRRAAANLIQRLKDNPKRLEGLPALAKMVNNEEKKSELISLLCEKGGSIEAVGATLQLYEEIVKTDLTRKKAVRWTKKQMEDHYGSDAEKAMAFKRQQGMVEEDENLPDGEVFLISQKEDEFEQGTRSGGWALS